MMKSEFWGKRKKWNSSIKEMPQLFSSSDLASSVRINMGLWLPGDDQVSCDWPNKPQAHSFPRKDRNSTDNLVGMNWEAPKPCYMFQNTKQSPWFPEGKKVDHFWDCSLVLSDHSDSVVSKNKQQRDWTLRRLQWHSSIFWKYNVVTNLLIYCDGTVLASDLWGHHTCDMAHALLSRNAPGPHKHREEASVSLLWDTKCEVHSLVQGHTVASAGQRPSELGCLPFVCLGTLCSGVIRISPSMTWKDPSTFPYVCYLNVHLA